MTPGRKFIRAHPTRAFNGEALFELRMLRKLKLDSVGLAVGVSGNQVWRWENGVVEPSPENLAKLAAGLKCKPSALLKP